MPQTPMVVANNMIMQAETAHVLQTCRMLEAFGQAMPDLTYLWPDFGARVAVLDRISVTLAPIACRFRYGAGRYGEFTARLLARLRALAPPLLFTRNLGVALAAQTVVPRVILELHQGLSPRARRVAPWLGPRVGVVAISEALRQDLTSDRSVAADRIIACHDGVEFDRFAAAEPLPDQERPSPAYAPGPIHLYYGTLRPERGLDLIRHAAERLPDHGFVLVGGDLRAVATALASGLDRPNVRVVPALPHDRMPSLLRSYHSVLLPYTQAVTTHRWMSPLKLFEAMAAGVPVVVSRLGPVTEVVDERHAALIDPNQPETLVAALTALAADPDAACRRATAAQALAQTRYSWARRARTILDFAAMPRP